MNWVEFTKNYEICEETAEIKSKARSFIVGTSVRNIDEKILKPQNGFFKANHKSYNVEKLYKEVFGREYESYRN